MTLTRATSLECWGQKPIGVGSGDCWQKQNKKPKVIPLLRICYEGEIRAMKRLLEGGSE